MTVDEQNDVQRAMAQGAGDGFPPAVERVLGWLLEHVAEKEGGSQKLLLREENARSLCEQMAGGDEERATYMQRMFEAALYEWNQKYVEGSDGPVGVP